MAAKIDSVTPITGENAALTERGGYAAHWLRLVYAAADDQTLSIKVDTADLGAGSVAFTVDNRYSPQDAVLSLFAHNGDRTLREQIPFKDLDDTETATDLTVAGGTSSVWTLTENVNITAGTFTLSYGGSTTTAIAHDAVASAIQDALQKLPTIGPGGVTVTGGPIGTTPVVITFSGPLAYRDVSALTATQTGLTGSFTISETTPGADGDYVNVIISYASYPLAMAMRFFELDYNPDAAMGAAVNIPVYISVK